jgi:membrane-associated phospholipid phosphatase
MLIRNNPRASALIGVGSAAAAAFALLTLLQRDRRLSKEDRKALKKIVQRYGKHEQAARSLFPVGKWWSYLPAAAAAGAAVYAKGRGRHRDRAAGAVAPLLAATVAALVNPLFDNVLPQPPPPPGRAANPEPSFPSGHASGLGAVAMTAAYVLHREHVINTATAAPLALLPPIIGGVARIIERKHWPSEVVGGLLVAAVIASLSALVYELERAEQSPHSEARSRKPEAKAKRPSRVANHV